MHVSLTSMIRLIAVALLGSVDVETVSAWYQRTQSRVCFNLNYSGVAKVHRGVEGKSNVMPRKHCRTHVVGMKLAGRMILLEIQ